MDTTDYLVKKMQRQLRTYQDEVISYKLRASEAPGDVSAARYEAEVRYWSGMYDATYAAIAMIQDAEVTGGTPF